MAKAKAKTTTTKAPVTKPYRINRYGIQNHVGGVWTPETFQTPEAATAYLESQRPKYGGLTKRHKAVPVRVTISIDRRRGCK